MSAFARLPADYRKLCEEIAAREPRRIVGRRKIGLSPQNRRVRLGADFALAERKTFAHRDTRQQRRAASKPWKDRT